MGKSQKNYNHPKPTPERPASKKADLNTSLNKAQGTINFPTTTRRYSNSQLATNSSQDSAPPSAQSTRQDLVSTYSVPLINPYRRVSTVTPVSRTILPLQRPIPLPLPNACRHPTLHRLALRGSSLDLEPSSDDEAQTDIPPPAHSPTMMHATSASLPPPTAPTPNKSLPPLPTSTLCKTLAPVVYGLEQIQRGKFQWSGVVAKPL